MSLLTVDITNFYQNIPSPLHPLYEKRVFSIMDVHNAHLFSIES